MTHNRAFVRRPLLMRLVVLAVALLWSSTASFAVFPPKSTPAASDGADRAQDSTSSMRSAVTDAERLIDHAINQIISLDSVTADLVQTIEMLNQTFTIRGRYLKAPGGRIYLRLVVADTDFQTVQVCDGETLWDFQNTHDSPVFTRLSIKPVLERLASTDLDLKTKEIATTQIGLAGADSLLVGLRKYYKFDIVEKEETVLNGKAVWSLRGKWASEPGTLALDSRPVGPRGIVPPYIPGNATLYLGKADLWPYKLVIVGEQPTGQFDTRRRGLNGEPIGARSSIERLTPTRIDLVYNNLVINTSNLADEFQAPRFPGVATEDRTEAIIKSLDRAMKLAADTKRLKAARLEEKAQVPVIEIPIPPTDDAPTPR